MIKGKLQMIVAMLVLGTIGLFVRNIPLPSGMVALARGGIGTVFLLVVLLVRREGAASLRHMWEKKGQLALSGAAIGINWVLLFQSYRYTTIAVSTLSYYLAPVFVIAASPLVLKERLTKTKVGCVLVSLAGMVLVANVDPQAMQGGSQALGIFFGIAAAALYASVTLQNKFIHGLTGMELTVGQLFFAFVVLLPYVLVTEGIGSLGQMNTRGWILLLVVGVVHTGMAYVLYLSALQVLKGQTAALYSYVDPVTAILVSALVLGESMGVLQAVGAVLILGSTLVSEGLEQRLQARVRKGERRQ